MGPLGCFVNERGCCGQVDSIVHGVAMARQVHGEDSGAGQSGQKTSELAPAVGVLREPMEKRDRQRGCLPQRRCFSQQGCLPQRRCVLTRREPDSSQASVGLSTGEFGQTFVHRAKDAPSGPSVWFPEGMDRQITAAATMCATFVDEWVRSGIRHAFVAPGSRSTPLAIALSDRPEVNVHIFHDERSASFGALGVGLESGVPAVALCSSGTAGAHMHAAVIEASLMAIPMIVCTADRPPELWDVGAPQVIDQTHLFGTAPRWFCEPGLADNLPPSTWRSLASRLVAEAAGAHPGPVHANLSFTDPLAGLAAELPPGRPDNLPWHRAGGEVSVTEQDIAQVAAMVLGRSGAIVAGTGVTDPAAVHALASAIGWPVLADHQSQCRRAGSIVHYDSLLRDPEFRAMAEVQSILRFGSIGTSKPLAAWIAASGADIVSARNDGWSDPDRVAALVVPERGLAAALLARVAQHYTPASTAAQWAAADAAAASAISVVRQQLRSEGVALEVDVAEAALGAAVIEGGGGAAVIASSMPIRDAEWFVPGQPGMQVFANRGANGIDGTIATAIGVAAAPRPTVALVGDVAFLHDATSLTGLAQRGLDLTIVVVDNDGGGIFSFLPQHEQLAGEQFELLFGTPHGTDLAALAGAHGLPVIAFEDWDRSCAVGSGVRVVVASTDRSSVEMAHARMHRAASAAAIARAAEPG